MNTTKKRVLISVYYKEGIEKIAKSLHNSGWEIISTGGTAEFLINNSIPVQKVSDLTGFPEILGGRVKTLHPVIFGPILAKKSPEHSIELKKFSLSKIDMVIVNFYPFEDYLKLENTELDTMIEKIDIGGPSMVRAAAKNYKDTVVIVDKNDYSIVEEKVIPDTLTQQDRKNLSSKAFKYTSYYDSLIGNYLSDDPLIDSEYLNLSGKKHFTPRYGENPHQKASLFISDHNSPLKNLKKLHGKELSYNNFLDLSMVYDVLNQFKDNTENFCVIVKHQNPCGAALGDSQEESFEKALSGDPVSSFGGIVGFTKRVEIETAEKLSKIFFEVIIAPSFNEDALKVLRKKKNLRLIEINPGYIENLQIKSVPGGFIVQEKDNLNPSSREFKLMTGRKPNEREMKDISFGWKLVKFIKSNAILIVKDEKILGVGAGQMSRIDSIEIAIKKASDSLPGSVLISDAFFPFKDSILTSAENGINVIVEPGGSVRDSEVIETAEEFGISLLFTGIRHFLH